jgi:uncharacterized protein (DUF924 family)
MPDDGRNEWERVLDFWFGELDAAGQADAEHAARWWRKDPELDSELRTRFETDHAAIEAGHREHWRDDPRGLVAYVIVLDQLSRNMYRGTPRMFASDRRALEAARQGIDRGLERALPTTLRAFLYMPFMHSERLADQDRAVVLFGSLGSAEQLDFAIQHRDIVARFGRFPHRNAILGRESTPEEIAFLAEPGSSF